MLLQCLWLVGQGNRTHTQKKAGNKTPCAAGGAHHERAQALLLRGVARGQRRLLAFGVQLRDAVEVSLRGPQPLALVLHLLLHGSVGG